MVVAACFGELGCHELGCAARDALHGTDVRQAAVRERQESEAQMLANLTGWDIDDIRSKVPWIDGQAPEPAPVPWWKRIWQ